MSSTSRAWTAAVAVGAVEALKDQGFCRWNHAIRSIHQLSKNKIRSSSSAARQLRRPITGAAIGSDRVDDGVRQSDESLRRVMYLNCWGQG
ncbi:hypothetical protein LINGRAHAP2_LOCUS18789 [Linum grandiflorum]